ncbi:DEAD/DEAH box helicase [Actinomadura formosensis]|uniref:DEAD/DEAH box helicase n=1 Tax=Actinomadura formosensis TaxID=60706 RepID=UPI003D8DA3B4
MIRDYSAFAASLVEVRDERIAEHLREEEKGKVRWPDPWLPLNPNFEPGGTVANSSRTRGSAPLILHRHRREAIEAAREKDSYVLTTGTGSGKSLSYIVPIVDSVLRDPEPGRIKAIVVYPMNALANSQLHELEKYLTWGMAAGDCPVTFACCTGQELPEERDRVISAKPDILLTNGAPFIWDEERRFAMRVELDAAYFHLCGVGRDDVGYIMDSFGAFQRNDPERFARTKALILDVYDAMARAMETGEPYKTILDPPPGEGPRHPDR